MTRMKLCSRAAVWCLGALAACAGDSEAPEAAGSGTGGAEVTVGVGGTGGTGGSLVPTTLCPSPEMQDVGTNTVVRIHAELPIDAATVSPSSVLVSVGGVTLSGALDVASRDIKFTPDAPLPPRALVQVELSPDVHDVQGRSLVEGGVVWEFTTGSGPVKVPGLTFSEPKTPPYGMHVPYYALAMNDDRAFLAMATGAWLVGTSFDGSTFVPPLVIQSGGLADQPALAVGGGFVHFVWTYFDGPGTIIYNRADMSLEGPSTPSLALSPASYQAKVAAHQNGEVAIAWDVHPDYWDPDGPRITTSFEGGSSFSDPQLLAYEAACPALAYVDGLLVAAWIFGSELRIATSADNGASFGAPVTLATTTTKFWCPAVVDNHVGEALVLWEQGPGAGKRSTHVRSYAPASGTLGSKIQLVPPDETNACSNIASSPTGEVVVAHSHGSIIQADWVTELYLSDDGGHTFGSPVAVDVIDKESPCPDVGYGLSGHVYLAWNREDYELAVSRGAPKRPCE